MDHADMTIEEFEELAFSLGADMDVWPEVERVRAATFLATSPDGQTVLARARGLEAALRSVRPADPLPSEDLMSRILADAAGVRPQPAPVTAATARSEVSIFDRLRTFLSPAAACAASATLGLWLGYAGPVDFTGVAVDALGVETETEFAFLDGAVASPMAGFIDVLEAE